MPEEYPTIQGGGSLILAWQIKNKRVLVVGGGEVAAGRILNVLNADANVTVVSPRDGLNEEVAYRIDKGQVEYVDRKFEPSDLDDADMVLTAVDDPEASTQIWKLCKEKKVAANIADVPPECDFYFGSVHRDGPLQIMVSTNGNGPKLASIVRKQIAANLPDNIGAAIQKVGLLRRKLRKLAPATEEGPKRMQWMSKVCESWSLENLVEMDEDDMERLLGFYNPGEVPSFDRLRLGDPPEDFAFDGSFGWCTQTSSGHDLISDISFGPEWASNPSFNVPVGPPSPTAGSILTEPTSTSYGLYTQAHRPDILKMGRICINNGRGKRGACSGGRGHIGLLFTSDSAMVGQDSSQVLHSPTSRALLGQENNSSLLENIPVYHNGWMEQIVLRAQALVESKEATARQNLLEELHGIATASLDSFLQSNVTGPPLTWNPADVLFPKEICGSDEKLRTIRRDLIRSLSVDGGAVYKLIPNVELFCLAKCLLNNTTLGGPESSARYRWDRVTINFWHQKLLSEHAASLQESIYRDLDILEHDLSQQDPNEKARRLIQRATIHTQHGLDQKAREDLARATTETGFDFKLTGRLGKRTKYQEKDLSQLVVLAKSADPVENGTAAESGVQPLSSVGHSDHSSNGATFKPQHLDLNDDTLLEFIAFSKPPSQPSLSSKADISPALAALDPSNQPVLQPLDSIILLAYASSITNTSPSDGLTREETLPYALRVLQDGDSNWQIYTQGLLVRSRIEGYKSRTVERSVLQLQALVDQVIVETTPATSGGQSQKETQDAAPSTFFPKPKPSESASASERLRYLPQLASSTRWELEAELASRWVSLGGLRTALEIYERLQMWAEVALCWAANDREDKARRIIRRQLYTSSSAPGANPAIDDEDDDTKPEDINIELHVLPADAPRLFCILGDLENSPSAYQRAWEVSSQRYARAQRSLGKYHFTHGDLRSADTAYAKALKVNSLNHSTWFSLGCVRLQLEDWPGAVEAFARAIQIEEQDAESWSNMAAALIQLTPDISINGADPSEKGRDDDEDVTAVNMPKMDPQKHIQEAFIALKRAAALKRDSYRIWQNLLNVAVKLSPPPYADIIVAQTRLIELQGKSEGEKSVDVDVMEGLLAHLVATCPPAPAEEDEMVEEKTRRPGFERMLIELVQNKITPLITSSRRLWLLTAKLSLHLQKPLATLQAYEKAWRVTLNQPGWESGTKESEGLWRDVVDATEDLVDAYESLGARTREGGMGEGELVAKDWKFKARSA
ncbi:MAG: hypothetical protein L6R35_005340, partial [Caloplaca aegaea]